MGDYGLKTSKGGDVRGLTIKDSRFNSSALSPKILKVFKVTISIPSGTGSTVTTKTVQHGLGGTYAIMSFVKNNGVLNPVQGRMLLDTNKVYQPDVSIDGSDINFMISNSTITVSDQTFEFKTYVFTDKLE